MSVLYASPDRVCCNEFVVGVACLGKTALMIAGFDGIYRRSRVSLLCILFEVKFVTLQLYRNLCSMALTNEHTSLLGRLGRMHTLGAWENTRDNILEHGGPLDELMETAKSKHPLAGAGQFKEI